MSKKKKKSLKRWPHLDEAKELIIVKSQHYHSISLTSYILTAVNVKATEQNMGYMMGWMF